MILGVKIQNRETKQYMGKGISWNKVGKVWSRFRDAKLAICPVYLIYHGSIEGYEKELNSDFIIINDDGTQERKPVAIYFIDYIKRNERWHNKEKVELILKQISQFAKTNNIELEG